MPYSVRFNDMFYGKVNLLLRALILSRSWMTRSFIPPFLPHAFGISSSTQNKNPISVLGIETTNND
ncbi:hypothetical protein BGZ61DRAFT_453723 [Ilyonectria robusta]|uniref:uncharacterized protein n=1 Tax=Ilyonectria robusta TaxID=1079257 RepID=UPI001E8E4C05|nr:uncharacterized protein BGZ61DRAFT_453723 [Ilyonectria robusta]KAH8686833.1 hypothetical protein BGZ61DRAFT_453723 [Ilyonectria robusta]